MLKCKKVYLPEETIAQIQDKIRYTGQSFSDYVRMAVQENGIKEWYLPIEYLEFHTNQMSELVNVIRSYMIQLAEKDVYGDYFQDLVQLQLSLQQLIDGETELLNRILCDQEADKKHGNSYVYAVQ